MFHCCGLLRTKESNVSIVEHFGKFQKVADPGFTCLVPCVDTVAGTLSLRVQQLSIFITSKTLDDVTVVIEATLQYRVLRDQVEVAFYSLENATELLKSSLIDAVRSAVPLLKLDELFETKKEFSAQICDRVSDSFKDYGKHTAIS